MIVFLPLSGYAYAIASAGISAYAAYKQVSLSKQNFEKLRKQIEEAPPIFHPSKRRTTRENGLKDPRY